jgi:hypothetical protein
MIHDKVGMNISKWASWTRYCEKKKGNKTFNRISPSNAGLENISIA